MIEKKICLGCSGGLFLRPAGEICKMAMKYRCKSELVIGVGCTGGKHRSVTVARLLNTHFLENGQKSSIHHRDIWKA